MYKKSQATCTLTSTKSHRNVCVCISVDGCADVSSSQADSVGASSWIVDGRAGGLGHSPFIPHFLPIVAAPESHRHVIVPGYGDGLFEGEEDGEPGEHSR